MEHDEKDQKAVESPPPSDHLEPGTHQLSTIQALDQVRKDDKHHPRHWPVWQKWAVIICYCLLQVFVTITTTSYIAVEFLLQEKFGGSTQVITLGQSLFIIGNALGPVALGPLS